MKKHFTQSVALLLCLILVFSMVPVQVLAAGLTDTMEAKTYTNDSVTLPYRIYYPTGFDVTSENKVPVLLFLHGAGERGTDNAVHISKNNQLITKVIARDNCVVIAPQCPADYKWVDTDWTEGSYDSTVNQASAYLEAAEDLLESVIAAGGIDADRVWAAGISMGGYGTWNLIMNNPDLYAAAIPVCGAADPNKAAALVDMPIWTFHGDADTEVPISGTNEMVQAIRNAGGTNVKYTVYAGAGHIATWEKAFAEPNLLNWLYSQSKAASSEDQNAGLVWQIGEQNGSTAEFGNQTSTEVSVTCVDAGCFIGTLDGHKTAGLSFGSGAEKMRYQTFTTGGGTLGGVQIKLQSTQNPSGGVYVYLYSVVDNKPQEKIADIGTIPQENMPANGSSKVLTVVPQSAINLEKNVTYAVAVEPTVENFTGYGWPISVDYNTLPTAGYAGKYNGTASLIETGNSNWGNYWGTHDLSVHIDHAEAEVDTTDCSCHDGSFDLGASGTDGIGFGAKIESAMSQSFTANGGNLTAVDVVLQHRSNFQKSPATDIHVKLYNTDVSGLPTGDGTLIDTIPASERPASGEMKIITVKPTTEITLVSGTVYAIVLESATIYTNQSVASHNNVCEWVRNSNVTGNTLGKCNNGTWQVVTGVGNAWLRVHEGNVFDGSFDTATQGVDSAGFGKSTESSRAQSFTAKGGPLTCVEVGIRCRNGKFGVTAGNFYVKLHETDANGLPTGEGIVLDTITTADYPTDGTFKILRVYPETAVTLEDGKVYAIALEAVEKTVNVCDFVRYNDGTSFGAFTKFNGSAWVDESAAIGNGWLKVYTGGCTRGISTEECFDGSHWISADATSSAGDSMGFGKTTESSRAQSFTANGGTLTRVEVGVRCRDGKFGVAAGDFYVKLHETDASGLPTGEGIVLDTITTEDYPTDGTFAVLTVYPETPVTLEDGKVYAIALEAVTPGSNVCEFAAYKPSIVFGACTKFNGTKWTAEAGWTGWLRVYTDAASSENSNAYTYTVPEDWATNTNWLDFPKSVSPEMPLVIEWDQTQKQSQNLILITDSAFVYFSVKLNGHKLYNNTTWFSEVHIYLPMEYQVEGTNRLEITGTVGLDCLYLQKENFNRNPLTAMYYLQEWGNEYESFYDIAYNIENNIDYGYMFDWIDGYESYTDWGTLEPERGNYNFDNSQVYHSMIMEHADELFADSPRKLFLHNGGYPEWATGKTYPAQHDISAEDMVYAEQFYRWLLDEEGVADYIVHSETTGETKWTWKGTTKGFVEIAGLYNKIMKEVSDGRIYTTSYAVDNVSSANNSEFKWALQNNHWALKYLDAVGWHYYSSNKATQAAIRKTLDANGGKDINIVCDEGNEAFRPQLSYWLDYQVADLNMVGPGYEVSTNGWCYNGPVNPDTLELNNYRAQGSISSGDTSYVGSMMWSNIYHFSSRTFSSAAYGENYSETNEMWIGSSAKNGEATAVIQNCTGSAQTVKAIIPVPQADHQWTVQICAYNGPGNPLKVLETRTVTGTGTEIVLDDIDIGIVDAGHNEFRVVRIYDSAEDVQTGLAQVNMKVTEDERELAVGESVQMNLEAYLGDGTKADLTNATITYTSEDPSVVSVDENGVVTNLVDGGEPVVIRATVTLDGVSVESNGLRIYPAAALTPVAVTSSDGTGAAANDGNLNTMWTYNAEGDWLQYDFGETKSISRARFWSGFTDDGLEALTRQQFRHATILVSEDPNFETYTVAKVMDYEDTFDAASDLWQPVSGTWTVADGVYSQTDASVNGAVFNECYNNACWDDYHLEADFTAASESGYAGFAFRVQDENNYYLLKINEKQAQVFKVVDGVETAISDLVTINHDLDIVNTNHVRVVAEDDGIRIYYNKQAKAIIDIVDTTYTTGAMGLYTEGTAASFDNVTMNIIGQEEGSTEVYFPEAEGRYVRVVFQLNPGPERVGELEVFGSDDIVGYYNASCELNDYVATLDKSKFREEEIAQIDTIVEEGLAAIASAQTAEECSAALADAKAKLDALKTDNEKTQEENAAAVTAAQAAQKAAEEAQAAAEAAQEAAEAAAASTATDRAAAEAAAQQAADAKTAAEAAQKLAEDAKAAAEAAAKAAKENNDAAAQQATAAAASAAAAAEDQAAAAESAAAAAQSAKTAQDAQAAAETAKTAAEQAKADALNAKAAAEEAANNAGEDATAAANAKTAAEAAQKLAEDAQAAAEAAEKLAGDAKTAAEAAAKAAEEKNVAAAKEAKNAAEEALKSATSATEAAKSASESATYAATAAQAAKDAQVAQKAAEEAAKKAEADKKAVEEAKKAVEAAQAAAEKAALDGAKYQAVMNLDTAAMLVDQSGYTTDQIEAHAAAVSAAKEAIAAAETLEGVEKALAEGKAAVGAVEEMKPVNPFVDIAEDMFCYDAVLWAAEKDITTGKDATHFDPSGDCTRAQVVTFLWRAAGKPEPKDAKIAFPDVATGKYYTKAVAWAVENGITAGYKDGTFGPNDTCTRGQIVTFLWRYAGEEDAAANANFPDVAVDKYYGEAVMWAVKNGITTGYKDGTFGPDKTCTRDQIVTFLYRYMAN